MSLTALKLVFGAPALPLHAAGKYVAGAYIFFLLVIVVYVAIMGVRLARNQREIQSMKAELDERARATEANAAAVAEAGKQEQVV